MSESKISLLPRKTREELNVRLREGESGTSLRAWLNGLPEVQELMARRFAGAEVSLQNLSAWRRGGYQQWLLRTEAREAVDRLVGESDGMRELSVEGAMTQGALSERLSAVLASRYAWVLSNWNRLGEDGFEQELKALRSVSREVARLRKGDHSVVRLDLRRDWRQDYSNKQFMELFKEMADSDRLGSWARVKWPTPERAAEFFWSAMGYHNTEIAEIMKQPDRMPPWKSKAERDGFNAAIHRKWDEQRAEQAAYQRMFQQQMSGEGQKPENN